MKIANRVVDELVEEYVEDIPLLTKKLKPILPKVVAISLFTGAMVSLGAIKEEAIRSFLLKDEELRVIKED